MLNEGNPIRRRDKLLLLLLVSFAFIVRIYKADAPFLGNFSVRASAYATIAEKFLEGQPLHKPTNYIIVNGEPSYELLEFPIFAYIVAILSKFFNISLEFSGRFTSIIYTCISIILIYLVARRYFGGRVGLIAAGGFSLSPSILIYGRSFHAEPFLIVIILLAVYCYLRYSDTKNYLYYLISLISFSLALLARIQLSWYLVFLIWFIDYSIAKNKPVLNIRILSYLSIGILPAILWYAYTFYAVSIYPNVVYSLHHQINTRAFPSPLLFSLKFYQILFDYLVTFAFNPIGFFILLYGLSVRLEKKCEYVFYLWVISVFFTYFIIPQKIIEHNYYFAAAIPPLAIFFALGLNRLIEGKIYYKTLLERKWFLFILIGLYLLASFRYYLHPAFKIPKKDQRLLAIAKNIREVTKKDDRIILVNGSTPLFFYSRRNGWFFSLDGKNLDEYQSQWLVKSIPKEKINQKIEASKDLITWLNYLILKEGADFFVCSRDDIEFFRQQETFYAYMYKNYRLMFEDEDCIIFNLN